MPIPSDAHVPGDTGHVTDHNNIADTLTALTAGAATETTRATAAEALLAPLTSPALTGTPTAPTAAPHTGTTQIATTAYADAAGAGGGGGSSLTQTAVQTGNYTAAANQIVPVDTTSGNVTVTLPTAPAGGTLAAVKQVIQGTGHAVTVTCAGTDVYNKAGGSTSLTLPLASQGVLLEYGAGIWMVLADDMPLTQLDGRYTQKPLPTEQTYYVSSASSASDSNDGLTVYSAKATIAGAQAALGSNAGKIQLGAGTWTISSATTDANGNTAAVMIPRIGTVIEGLGPELTFINVACTAQWGLVVQGTYCEVRNLMVQTVAGGNVTWGTGVDTAIPNGSTEGCKFYNVISRQGSAGTMTNGFGVGASHTNTGIWGNVDVAQTQIVGCVAEDCATGAGFYVGQNGVAGNVSDTTFIDCYGNANMYGAWVFGGAVSWYGGCLQHSSYSDIYLTNVDQAHFSGFRSENSTRLLYAPPCSGNNAVTIKDILWTGKYNVAPTPSAAGDYIVYGQSGTLNIENVILSAKTSGIVPAFNLSAGGAGVQPLTVNVNGLSVEAPVNQVFWCGTTSPITVQVSGFLQISNTTGYILNTTPLPGVTVLMPSTALYLNANGTSHYFMQPADVAFDQGTAATFAGISATASPGYYYTTDTSILYHSDGVAWTDLFAGVSASQAPNIQVFGSASSSGTFTWTQPTGMLFCDVTGIGATSGGGSGSCGAAGTVRTGGGGSAGGDIVTRRFMASALAATETVNVAAAGTGGAGVTIAAGNAGNAATGTTSFGTTVKMSVPSAGVGNAGGTAAANARAGIINGSAGEASTTTGSPVAPPNVSIGGGGGGAGGSIPAGNTASNGGSGTVTVFGSGTYGAHGIVDTTAPTSGTAPTINGTPACGAGGGASSNSAPSGSVGPQAGANAQWPGGGAGGGGASLTPNTSGPGGNGANGCVVVTSYFQLYFVLFWAIWSAVAPCFVPDEHADPLR